MACIDHVLVYMQTAVKYRSLYIHTPGALRTPGVVYIESVVFYSSLHIHHQIVHTSHFPIFSRPNPRGGVYLWGPNVTFVHIPIKYLVSHLSKGPGPKAFHQILTNPDFQSKLKRRFTPGLQHKRFFTTSAQKNYIGLMFGVPGPKCTKFRERLI